MRLTVAAFVVLALASAAVAQQATPSAGEPPAAAVGTPATPSAAPSDDDADDTAPTAGARKPRQPDPKRIVCRDKARQQGLRGQQLQDNLQICVEELRLACTKKAVAQKIPNRQRRAFVRSCAG